MAKKNQDDKVPAQSQSQAGPTAHNPNEDVAEGNQSRIQPGGGAEGPGGTSSGDPATSTTGDGNSGSTPSDGGNPAANQGGSSGTAGQ